MISKARNVIRISLLAGLIGGSLVIDSHPACASPIGAEGAAHETSSGGAFLDGAEALLSHAAP